MTTVGRGWESELEKSTLCGLLPSLGGPLERQGGRITGPLPLGEKWESLVALLHAWGLCYCPLSCASLGKSWLRAEVRHLPASRVHPPQHLEPPVAEEQDLLSKAGDEGLILVRGLIPV